MSLETSLFPFERQLILEALKRNNWHLQKTADELEINRVTLYKKMQQHAIIKT